MANEEDDPVIQEVTAAVNSLLDHKPWVFLQEQDPSTCL